MRKFALSRRQREEPAGIVLVSVPCPVHGTDLKVQVKDGRMIAVCKCKTPKNPYLDQVVWERIDTRRIL